MFSNSPHAQRTNSLFANLSNLFCSLGAALSTKSVLKAATAHVLCFCHLKWHTTSLPSTEPQSLRETQPARCPMQSWFWYFAKLPLVSHHSGHVTTQVIGAPPWGESPPLKSVDVNCLPLQGYTSGAQLQCKSTGNHNVQLNCHLNEFEILCCQNLAKNAVF